MLNVSMGATPFFLPFLQLETTFLTFCLLSSTSNPFKRESTLKGKNLLLGEQILSTPIGKGANMENVIAPNRSVPIHSKYDMFYH